MTPHPATGEPGTRRLTWRALLIVLIIAVAIASGRWWLVGRHQATPWVVEGYAQTNARTSALSLHDTDVGRFNDEGVMRGSAQWRIKNGPWREQGTCLKPLETHQHVRAGIIETQDGPSRYVLVWLQCLD